MAEMKVTQNDPIFLTKFEQQTMVDLSFKVQQNMLMTENYFRP